MFGIPKVGLERAGQHVAITDETCKSTKQFSRTLAQEPVKFVKDS